MHGISAPFTGQCFCDKISALTRHKTSTSWVNHFEIKFTTNQDLRFLRHYDWLLSPREKRTSDRYRQEWIRLFVVWIFWTETLYFFCNSLRVSPDFVIYKIPSAGGMREFCPAFKGGWEIILTIESCCEWDENREPIEQWYHPVVRYMSQ